MLMKKTIILFAVFFILPNAHAEKDNSIEQMDIFNNCVKSGMIELEGLITPASETVFNSLLNCMKPLYDFYEEEGGDNFPEKRDDEQRMQKREKLI